MIKGFRDFIMRGNVIDLAIAVVIGAAFTGVVGAFTEKILQPLINVIGGGGGGGLTLQLKAGDKSTIMDFSALISATINFLIVAAVVYFLIVVPMNKLMEMRKRGEVPEVTATPEDIALLQEIRDLLRDRPQA